MWFVGNNKCKACRLLVSHAMWGNAGIKTLRIVIFLFHYGDVTEALTVRRRAKRMVFRKKIPEETRAFVRFTSNSKRWSVKEVLEKTHISRASLYRIHHKDSFQQTAKEWMSIKTKKTWSPSKINNTRGTPTVPGTSTSKERGRSVHG